MLNTNDPRINEVANIIIGGLVEIFSKCVEVYRNPTSSQGSQGQTPTPSPPPPPPISPEKLAIRRANIPTGAVVREEDLPPEMPDKDAPIDPSKLKVPTWGQLINLYAECSLENYKKNFYPCEKARSNNLSGIKKVLSRLKIPLDKPYTCLTRQRINELEDIGLKEGVSRATIQTWRGYIKSVTARWAVLMYEDKGWNVKSIVTQPFNTAQKAYEALPQDVVEKIDAWIAGLAKQKDRREDFKFVWIMRNLAVRNGDVFRFVWGNFTDNGDKVHSAYIPHKTSKNSKRRATWDLSKAKFEELGRFRGNAGPKDTIINVVEEDWDEFQRKLNSEIKEILPEGRNKGLYELRKLSAHEAYMKFGRQAAVRKTGDSFETLDVHYVDTSTGNENEFD